MVTTELHTLVNSPRSVSMIILTRCTRSSINTEAGRYNRDYSRADRVNMMNIIRMRHITTERR